jgi:hypothetical protein
MTEDLAQIQPEIVAVDLDLDLPAIRIEVVDPAGEGFSALLDADEVIDLVCKLIGALERLHQGEFAS